MAFTKEQAARGRATAAANRARRKAAETGGAQLVTPTLVPSPDEEKDDLDETQDAPQVQNEPIAVGATRGPQAKQESMTDKVLSALGLGKKNVLQPVANAANKAATRKRSSKDISADFVAGLVPVLALGIAVWVRMQIKDPAYQRCAPQTDEVSKVLTPLARILARRIEIAGKMSEDTVDLAIAFSMTGVMATRIYGDYITIKDGSTNANIRKAPIRETIAYENLDAGGYPINGNGSGFAAVANGNGNGHRPGPNGNGHASSNGHTQSAGRGGGRAGQTVDGGSNSAVPADGYAILDGRAADDVISRALAQDAGYRAANGLL